MPNVTGGEKHVTQPGIKPRTSLIPAGHSYPLSYLVTSIAWSVYMIRHLSHSLPPRIKILPWIMHRLSISSISTISPISPYGLLLRWAPNVTGGEKHVTQPGIEPRTSLILAGHSNRLSFLVTSIPNRFISIYGIDTCHIYLQLNFILNTVVWYRLNYNNAHFHFLL